MPTSRPSEAAAGAARLSAGGLAAGALAFAVLATLNAGGYRYGAADQAFYIPAALRHLVPGGFPRDGAMLAAQGRFFLVDEIAATLVSATGVGLPTWFAAAQALTLLLLFAGAVLVGTTVLRTRWALVAWLAALTLRHRIAKTGVNTLEGYFHPRVLVCAIGLVAFGCYLRGRPWLALALVAGAVAIHPSTAVFFGAPLAVAVLVTEARSRAVLVGGAAVAVAAAAWAFTAGPLGGGLVRMTPEWRALLASKDYLFPTADWSAGTWAVNLLGPVLLAAGYTRRVREGLASPRERALTIGALALLAGFLLTLPLVASGVALAVQLQTSRVFWVLELLGTLMLVWLVAEAGGRAATRAGAVLAMVLVLASTGRAVYLPLVEHDDRATVALDLPADDWTTALRWIGANTAAGTFVLADPGHAWKYGVPVRVGAARDVLLEEVKDVSMALYARDTADRVRERIDAIGDFSTLTTDRARQLADRFGLDLLITEAPLDLPVRFRSGRFVVQDLRAR